MVRGLNLIAFDFGLFETLNDNLLYEDKSAKGRQEGRQAAIG